MRAAFTAMILALGVSVSPGFAGDASGLDPKVIDQCIAEGGDCRDAGMEACRDYAAGKYTGDDPDFVKKNCLDASHQAWESKLSEAYEALMAVETDVGVKPTENLREAEYSWITFRDELCDYEKKSAMARHENPEIAELTCQRDEAARHWALLNARREALTK